MKKILLLTLVSVLLAGSTMAQKYAIIDTRYILDKMPEYKTAQKQLDDIAADWQKDIDTRQAALDKMYKDYDAEEVMLSEDLKKKRQDQLFLKEKEVRDLQRQRFGFEGDLFKKDRNSSSPYRTAYTTPYRKLPPSGATILCSIKVRELPLYLPTPNWTKVRMCCANWESVTKTGSAGANVKENRTSN